MSKVGQSANFPFAINEALSPGWTDQAFEIAQIGHTSRAHHAFRPSQRFPGSLKASAHLAGFFAHVYSLQRFPRVFGAVSGAFVSDRKIPFPGNRDFGLERRGSNTGLG
jgi:hypothetical protein